MKPHSVLTILQHPKKKQLSAVFLTRRNGGQIYVLPWVAMDDDHKKRFQIFRIGAWEILDFRTPLDPEEVKYCIDHWVEIAKCESTPAIIASSVPIKVKGVPVEPWGQYGPTANCAGQSWPDDWEEQARTILKAHKCEFEGSLLNRMLHFDQGNDLTKAFYAAVWLADRFRFFAITPEEAQRRLLDKGGARAVRGSRDLGAFSLKQWRQPQISGDHAPPSPLARPQASVGASIFSPGYKGRK